MEEPFEAQAARCLHGKSAPCTRACPFSLDVRDFAAKAGRGSFDAAFRVFRGAVVFPGIVLAYCPRPCETACVRVPMDEAVNLHGLEHAAFDCAHSREPPAFNLPEKRERVAIVGGGVSGLSCALRLANKKYRVTVFEGSGRVGGHLWERDPHGRFLDDFRAQFGKERYELVLDHRVESLDGLDFDAFYIATGAGGKTFGAGGRGDSLFWGGGLAGRDTVGAIADGAKAASAIDIYFRAGKRQATVKQDGPNLMLDCTGIAALPRVSPQDGNAYTGQEAAAEAGRCLRCDCDHCQRHNDLLSFYRKYPRELAEEVASTVAGDSSLSTRTSTRMLACENIFALGQSSCPAGIDVEGFLHKGHAAMQENGDMPPAFYAYWLNDLRHASGAAALSRPPPDGSEVRFLYFPGCQMGASEPDLVGHSYRLLLGIHPGTALALRCCGAPALWAGKTGLLEEQVVALRELWVGFGRPTLIFACPTCEKIAGMYLQGSKRVDLYSHFLENDVVPAPFRWEMACVFDPCSSRGNEAMQHAVRQLAGKANVALTPLPYEGERAVCCGFGGQGGIANPLYTATVTQKRLALSPLPYLTYCTNCRDAFAAKGKESAHMLELVCGLAPGRQNSPPTLTQRRRNRERLRDTLMETFWKEAASASKPPQFPLVIPDELRQTLSAGWMLEDDIAAAVAFCEESGRKIVDCENGCFRGHFAIGHLTYWVAYEKQGAGFLLRDAYSHRMKIREE